MKIKYTILLLLIVGLAYGGLNYYLATNSKSEDKQVTVTSSKSDLEKIMEEENFKKETVLRARKVANDKKKAIEVERHETALNLIESEYEAIRASEIELVGKNNTNVTSSLK